MPFVAKPSRIVEARAAYVERLERPTYAELSTEFTIPMGTLSVTSANEGWPVMRASFMEAQLAKADASGIILRAIKADRTILERASSVALLALEKLAVCIESVSPENAAGTQASALNTASFAFKNVLDGLKSAGLIGISKTLNDSGKDGNNQWNPATLNQINVTVQGLQAAVSAGPKATEATPASAPPVDV